MPSPAANMSMIDSGSRSEGRPMNRATARVVVAFTPLRARCDGSPSVGSLAFWLAPAA